MQNNEYECYAVTFAHLQLLQRGGNGKEVGADTVLNTLSGRVWSLRKIDWRSVHEPLDLHLKREE